MRNMPKIKNPIFLIILCCMSIFFILIIFYYNKNYFLFNFFPNKDSLSIFHNLILIIGQIFCLFIAISFIVFKDKIYSKRKEFALLLVTIIFFFLIIEIGSRIYLCNFADDSVRSRISFPNQCGLKLKYESHLYLNYHGTPNYVSPDGLNIHNSLGFRGPEIIIPKPQKIYRIVTLGGSTTYTVRVKSWKKDFARQLENELQSKFNSKNIEVINGGMVGWSSWESLINLQFNILDLKPNLIIIYHGTNDVHTRLVNPQYYKGDNSGGKKQWNNKQIPFFFHSTFLRLVTGTNPINDLSWFVSSPYTAGLTTNTGFIKQLNGTPMDTLNKNKPIYFERNLRNMIAISKANNISVLLSTWAHSNLFNDYAATPHYEFGFKENNDVVRKVGKTYNVFFYDFASDMPNDIQYWFDGRHVNEKGAELKGELFANYIFNQDNLKEEIELVVY